MLTQRVPTFQFDPEDSSSLILYGGGVVTALWLTTAIVGAIDSIPLVRTFLAKDSHFCYSNMLWALLTTICVVTVLFFSFLNYSKWWVLATLSGLVPAIYFSR